MEEVKKNYLYENGYFINIEITSDKLAEKLAKTKAVKEAISKSIEELL